MNSQRETKPLHLRPPEDQLAAMGLQLPQVIDVFYNFDLGSVDGTTLYLSGQGPLLENGHLARGKVGHDVSVPEARHHAMRTGLVLISAMREVLGSLEHVAQIRRVFGMVNSVLEFAEHPEVINECSDLFCSVFGSRAAFSCSSWHGIPAGEHYCRD
ncbi:RidA family protein [Ruegeria hyattellae]|uniref:RidA family protein n=1 Tax=Ruegeria hyattellae TaxID=3233337 RepID=UPI00355B7BEE